MWNGLQESYQAPCRVPPLLLLKIHLHQTTPTPPDQKQGYLFYVRKEPQRCQFLTSLLKNLHHNVYLINIKELRYCQDLSSKTASIPSILCIFQSYQSKLPFWLAEALHASTRRRQAGLFLQPRPLTPRASKTRHLQSPLSLSVSQQPVSS